MCKSANLLSKSVKRLIIVVNALFTLNYYLKWKI